MNPLRRFASEVSGPWLSIVAISTLVVSAVLLVGNVDPTVRTAMADSAVFVSETSAPADGTSPPDGFYPDVLDTLPPATTAQPDPPPGRGGGVTATVTASRGTQVQVTPTSPPPTTNPPSPVPVPGDCDSWESVFRLYGATDLEVQFFFGDARPWGVPRTNIAWLESRCGLDFINDNTSDRSICMLNGVHSQAGYADGILWPDGGWVLALFDLRGGRIVTTQAEASNPQYAAACLWLVRDGDEPDSFGGVNHWQPQ